MSPDRRVTLSDARPLLDPGSYQALCIEATIEWARQWKKWIARLVVKPLNYGGRPYTGKLCKFLNVGTNSDHPCAGAQSDFRQLWVEVNGAQPTRPDVTTAVFEGRLYEITVETVKLDRHGKERRPEHWYSIVREIHSAGTLTSQPSNTEPSNPSTLRTQTTHSTDQHSNTENKPLAERAVQKRNSLSLKVSGSK